MASRGALGGLAWRTASLADALVAGAYEVVFIETVGAGQAEVDVARTADTTIVVEAPGMGDEVQAIKAGILEIADVLVVNKADLPGAQATVQALQSSLGLAKRPSGAWSTPILTTIAETGEGVEALMEAVRRHQAYLRESGEGKIRERARAADRLEAELRSGLAERFRQALPDGRFEAERAVLGARRRPRRRSTDGDG
jgi:LAO/AO transport system kinase